MDGPTTRMLFESIRQDIRELKRDVADVLDRHERELEEIRELKWKVAGAWTVVVLLAEVGLKFIEHAFK